MDLGAGRDDETARFCCVRRMSSRCEDGQSSALLRGNINIGRR